MRLIRLTSLDAYVTSNWVREKFVYIIYIWINIFIFVVFVTMTQSFCPLAFFSSLLTLVTVSIFLFFSFGCPWYHIFFFLFKYYLFIAHSLSTKFKRHTTWPRNWTQNYHTIKFMNECFVHEEENLFGHYFMQRKRIV